MDAKQPNPIGPGETAGRAEARNVGSLSADGIDVRKLTAAHQRLIREVLAKQQVMERKLGIEQ